MHGKKRFQKRHTKAELRTSGIEICRLCHSGIHDLLSERELAEKFTTKEALLEHPGNEAEACRLGEEAEVTDGKDEGGRMKDECRTR